MARVEKFKKDLLAHEAAKTFARVVGEVLEKNDICRLAISGGSTPKEMFGIIANEHNIDFERVKVFFVDDRTVPPTHNDSNYKMANETLFKANIPRENIFRYETELAPEEAAAKYSETIEKEFNTKTPAFDIIFLGMGEDGHTASLFPETKGLDMGGIAIANEVPALNTWRLTLTKETINRANNIFFLIGGASKADVLHEALSGTKKYPINLIDLEKSIFLIDEEAGAKI